jgi:hypothetical protein
MQNDFDFIVLGQRRFNLASHFGLGNYLSRGMKSTTGRKNKILSLPIHPSLRSRPPTQRLTPFGDLHDLQRLKVMRFAPTL